MITISPDISVDQINRTIDAYPGETFVFGRGRWVLNQTLHLRGGRKYTGIVGQDGASVITAADRGLQLLDLHEDECRLEWLTLDGKGLFCDTSRPALKNLKINNVIFIVRAAGPHPNGIEATSTLEDCTIEDCLFHPLEGQGADHSLVAYWPRRLTIRRCEVRGLNGTPATHGLHILGAHQFLIEQCYFRDIRRMAVEFQGGGADNIVQDCWQELPALQENFDANKSCLGFSLPADQATGTIARRIVILAPQRPDGKGQRYGFEMAGKGWLIQDCVIDGINHAVAVTNGGSTGRIIGCHFENYLQAPDAPARRVSIEGGITNPALKAQLIGRGRPGRGRGFTAPPAPPPTPEPEPEPTPVKPKIIVTLSGDTSLVDLEVRQA